MMELADIKTLFNIPHIVETIFNPKLDAKEIGIFHTISSCAKEAENCGYFFVY